MENVFISNGTTQLVLIPQDEVDSIMLNKLLDDGPLEIEFIRQPVGILGQSVKNAVIIRKKQNYLEDDPIKIENVQRLSKSKAHLEIPREG
jgi:hypothetical protein